MVGIITLWAVLSTFTDNGICSTMLTPTAMMTRAQAERVAETMRAGGAQAEVVVYGTFEDGKFTEATR